jgi:hypothetical protein
MLQYMPEVKATSLFKNTSKEIRTFYASHSLEANSLSAKMSTYRYLMSRLRMNVTETPRPLISQHVMSRNKTLFDFIYTHA